jgi:hypothetical protein
MTAREYHEKYPDSLLVMDKVVKRRSAGIRKKGGYKPVSEKRGAQQCRCGEWFQPETAKEHRKQCIEKHPDLYEEGKDFVRCPECQVPMLRLGRHLRSAHGWDADRVAVEKGRGLQLSASVVTERRLANQDMEATKAKREATNLEKYGMVNAGATDDARKKAVKTSRRRYGRDHAMQTEEVRIRQYEAAQCAPSKLEAVFDSLTPANVVFTGYGGRFVRCKKPVRKFGREFRDLNPDFMVFPDNVLQSALSRSSAHEKLDRGKHRTRYVVELLGDYYHSEQVVGIPAEEHEKEIREAYNSAGIECLTLWEHDVLERWDSVGPMVLAWLEQAIRNMNEQPVWRKR